MGKDIFKNEEARNRQEEWYQRFLVKADCKVHFETIPTSFGESQILITGDISKPPLICLHAMLTGSAHLLSELKYLTKSYHLILPDIPGHSVRGIPNRLSYQDNSYIHWFSEIIEELEVNEIDLFGISLGGFIAHRFTAEYPKKVKKLALVVPAGIVQGSVFKGLAKMAIPMIKYRMNPTEEHLKALTDFLLTNWDEDWGYFLGDSMKDYFTPKSIPPVSSDETLKKLTMPCLVMGADQDISFPGKPLIERVKAHLPLVETELLKDTRHCPPTTDEFRKWLSNQIQMFFG
ncbi:MAG TPA: alpha/beta hydrolase [Gracilimonas sp.]|uniref:alpha/beta fold hydrolase n=1 Tax=Gracilimonas sp. TaxID=1974203 RepID=UPI002DA05E15|nr:alpha/beta hydrolase [Gracilimonas sp.]